MGILSEQGTKEAETNPEARNEQNLRSSDQGKNLNRNCRPLRSSRTVYKNRAIDSCSDKPAELKCFRTASANWSLLTRPWEMILWRAASSTETEGLLALESAEEAFALVLVVELASSLRRCECEVRFPRRDWPLRVASAVGERRPIPWDRMMRE
jgi:hypothetical protein